MSTRDGGPAFPSGMTDITADRSEYWAKDPGMSLRDWFAGQALAGIVAFAMPAPENAKELAYQYADALLAERKKDPSRG